MIFFRVEIVCTKSLSVIFSAIPVYSELNTDFILLYSYTQHDYCSRRNVADVTYFIAFYLIILLADSGVRYFTVSPASGMTFEMHID